MLHRNTTVRRDDMVRATTTTTRSIAAWLPVGGVRLLRAEAHVSEGPLLFPGYPGTLRLASTRMAVTTRTDM